MSQLVPFESAQLPAYLSAFKIQGNDLGTGFASFPNISIKGKVFNLKRGGETTLIVRPDGSGEPAFSIEVVILNANTGTAKNWYEKGFTEGSDDKPMCYSNDGIAPANDAAKPQATKCSLCPKGAYGSKINEDGSKGFECSNSKRLAVAMVDAIDDPILIRVPGASLKGLTAYADILAKRGVVYQQVVTKISFDAQVAHPQLTFAAMGFVGESTLSKVAESMNSTVVGQIIGTIAVPTHEETKGPETPEKVETKTAKPKAEAKPATVAEPAAEKPAPEVKAETHAPLQVDNGEIDSALDGIDWDA
jgi:hypothetical protein